MIILTQPNIKNFNPVKQSSTVKWAYSEWCLAEVEEPFDISEAEMLKNNIDFWWQCGSGWFAWEEFEEAKENWGGTFNGGLVECIAEAYNIGKEKNIACAIGTVCANIYKDPFELWDEMNINKK